MAREVNRQNEPISERRKCRYLCWGLASRSFGIEWMKIPVLEFFSTKDCLMSLRPLLTLAGASLIISAVGSHCAEAGVRHRNRACLQNGYSAVAQPLVVGSSYSAPAMGYAVPVPVYPPRNCGCYQSQAYKGFITRLP